MPKIRRKNVPPALLNHLLDRIRLREIPADQLGALADWLDTEPDVPASSSFKRFPEMTVCGEGELIKTFLTAKQAPMGEEIFWLVILRIISGKGKAHSLAALPANAPATAGKLLSETCSEAAVIGDQWSALSEGEELRVKGAVLLPDYAFVFSMSANPKPDDSVTGQNAERAIIICYPRRPVRI